MKFFKTNFLFGILRVWSLVRIIFKLPCCKLYKRVPIPWHFNSPKFSNSYLSSQYDDLQMNMKIALQTLPRKSQHFPLKILKNLQTVEVLGFELYVCFLSIHPIKSHIKYVVYVKTIFYTTSYSSPTSQNKNIKLIHFCS